MVNFWCRKTTEFVTGKIWRYALKLHENGSSARTGCETLPELCKTAGHHQTQGPAILTVLLDVLIRQELFSCFFFPNARSVGGSVLPNHHGKSGPRMQF